MKKLNLIFTAFFLLIGISSTFADVPETINFQGALKDENGEPVNDTKIIQFLIYDDETAGSLVWSEYQSSVEIVDGIFSVELGSDTAFPAGLFDYSELWITFKLGGDEMSPRQRILSIPYALISEESTYSDSAGCSYYAVSAIVADSANYAYSLEGAHLGDLVQQDELGNVNITGDLTAVGDVTATAFYGDGSNLSGITGIYDETYVHTAGPDTISSAAPIGTFHVVNSDSIGAGIKIPDAGVGINIQYVDSRGVKIDSTGHDGIYIGSSGNHGLNIDYTDAHGVFIDETGTAGIRIENAGTKGVNIASSGEDGVFIVEAGTPSTFTTNSGNNGIEVAGAEGHGLYVGQADIDGVYINSAGDDGIYIGTTGDEGIYIEEPGDYGIYIYSAGNDGIYVRDADDDGIYIGGSDDDGLYISSAGDKGIHVHSSVDDAIYIQSAGSPSSYYNHSDINGVEVAGAEGNGLFVGHADIDGLHVTGADDNGVQVTSDGSGVVSNTLDASSDWGVYTGDNIHCNELDGTVVRTLGRNSDLNPLEPGEIVCLSGGYVENLLNDNGAPIVNVSKADKSSSEAVFGVVKHKVDFIENEEELDDGKKIIQRIPKSTEGNVNPGDYLSIVILGPADVKVTENSDIKTGKKITVSETDGKAREIQRTDDLWTTGILGKALEDSNGKDKIKVYVNCK